jgi:hypothetical protein
VLLVCPFGDLCGLVVFDGELSPAVLTVVTFHTYVGVLVSVSASVLVSVPASVPVSVPVGVLASGRCICKQGLEHIMPHQVLNVDFVIVTGLVFIR